MTSLGTISLGLGVVAVIGVLALIYRSKGDDDRYGPHPD